MKPPEFDDPFFLGKALLLVEDPMTRVILAGCWSEPARGKDIIVRAVGGREVVHRFTTAARSSGHKHVFGLVDADFTPALAKDRGPVFRTERHEIENHLLDWNMLAKLARRKSASSIRDIAHQEATGLLPWMAVRSTLVAMKPVLWSFPGDPAVTDIATLAVADAWMKELAWRKETEALLKTWTHAHCATILRQHHDRLAAELRTDAWMTTFSGKEIVRRLRARVTWRRDVNDEDFARGIASRWVQFNAIPPFIDALRVAILA